MKWLASGNMADNSELERGPTVLSTIAMFPKQCAMCTTGVNLKWFYMYKTCIKHGLINDSIGVNY